MSLQRYVPIKPIASGGMADVWLGVQKSDTGFIRLCAIKSIKDLGPNQDDFIAMFRDEAKIGQSLQHNNIVQVYDFTALENGFALIMEYIQGVNLSQLLRIFRDKKQPIPLDIALYVVQSVAKGLQYVHTKKHPTTDEPLNIVHRDISPSNILISFDGEVKITDFGIAKAKVSNHETQVGVVKGKFQYMSPEQFTGIQADHRSDIFALATVLWECLAGRKLYENESEAQLIQMVLQRAPYPDLRQLNPEVDDELFQILAGAMHDDAEKRPQSAAEFQRSLEEYAARRSKVASDRTLSEFLHTHMAHDLEKAKALVRLVLTEGEKTQIPLGKSEKTSNVKEQVILESDLSMPTFGRGSLTLGHNQNAEPNTSQLQWVNQAGERTHTKHKRILKRKNQRSTLKSLLTFSTAIVLVGIVSAAIAQYTLKIDVMKNASSLKAKLRNELVPKKLTP